jgi:Glycosyl hydrolase family 115/Gylcosyl hydrolase family 115 C-terminal domain
MKSWSILLGLLLPALASAQMAVDENPATDADVQLVSSSSIADLYVDPHDAAVEQISGGLLADDLQRVSGKRPAVRGDVAALGSNAVLIGTIGQSRVIDQLAKEGKIDLTGVTGQWESYVWQTVADPLPGVHRALVIAGSDRRGTAYGVVELSKRIGVSPWYWWADEPVMKHAQLRVSGGRDLHGPPQVKYRGIFINDEDWGFRPWATKTLDPATGAVGPKTYAKVYELMLRLRLNLIWGAMHPGGTEFSMYPGNAQTADQWAIVTGSSHCEPMMRNNVFWPKSGGPWEYDINRTNIFNYWKESASEHGGFESIWTLGIRGIHDSPMKGPPQVPARIAMVEQIFVDQKSLIDQYITHQYGPPAECFIPYKEVLPLYNAGLKVPPEATLVWPDDNFGYIRRLGTPEERKRPGGSGVYYHVSYQGAPKNYLWVESISPGLMWEELRKTYDNDSRQIWMLNVGDIKPAEVAMDFFAELAWEPQKWGPDAQQQFLAKFTADSFGSAGPQVAELLARYYKLSNVHKPEHIDSRWLDGLAKSKEQQLAKEYQALMDEETAVSAIIPADRADAYFEMVGYAARMLAASGLAYSTDDAEQGKKWLQYIYDQTKYYNDSLAGGKWRYMMEVLGGKDKESAKQPDTRTEHRADDSPVTIDAAAFTRQTSSSGPKWQAIDGLGWSARAVSVLPAIPNSAWDLENVKSAPCLEYDFNVASATEATIRIHALPTMRLVLNGMLRIAVAIDDQPPAAIDIPGGTTSELDKIRSPGVINGRVTMLLSPGRLQAGKHTLDIYALDPGVVLDQIGLPGEAEAPAP